MASVFGHKKWRRRIIPKGTDVDAVNLGWQACSDLSVMSYGEALFSYAFSESTEEQVADYNAALNAAPKALSVNIK